MNLLLCLECKGSVMAENGTFLELTAKVVLLSKHLCYAGAHPQYWIGSRSFQHFLVVFCWFFFFVPISRTYFIILTFPSGTFSVI